MSSFACEKCGAIISDSPKGYVTGCEHYPKESNPTDGYSKFLKDNPPEKGGCIEYPPQPTGEKKNHNCLCSGIVSSSYDDGNFVRCGKCHGILPEQKPTGERKCSTCYYKRCPGNEGNGCSGWEPKPQPDDALSLEQVLVNCYCLPAHSRKTVDSNLIKDQAHAIRTYLKGELEELDEQWIDREVWIKQSDAIKAVKGEL